MPQVPDPITSPPAQPGQPYDAAGSGSGGKWVKTKEAGAASTTTGELAGGWPDNGASSDGGWKQT